MDRLDLVVQQWQKEKPALDSAPMAVIGRLLRISKHIETRITHCHKGFGLTPGEFDVLATLRRAANNGALTPSELIAALLLTSGAMTNRLDKLCEKKLIVRTHSEQDRRSVSVALTEQGRALIDQVVEAHVALLRDLLRGLDESEQTVLNATLTTWLGDFEAQIDG